MVSENISNKKTKKATKKRKNKINGEIDGEFIECGYWEEVEPELQELGVLFAQLVFTGSVNPKDYKEDDLKKFILFMDKDKLENPEFKGTDSLFINLYNNYKHQENEF